MNYKKYFLLLVFILSIGLENTVYAERKEQTNNNYDVSVSISYATSELHMLAAKPKPDKTETTHQSPCVQLIDSELKQIINEILAYPRYIVPAILIALGSLDIFKAVIAGKEDEMKKAQRTFIKRMIAGVLVYLVPIIINIMIWFANIAWQGMGFAGPCS